MWANFWPVEEKFFLQGEFLGSAMEMRVFSVRHSWQDLVLLLKEWAKDMIEKDRAVLDDLLFDFEIGLVRYISGSRGVLSLEPPMELLGQFLVKMQLSHVCIISLYYIYT